MLVQHCIFCIHRRKIYVSPVFTVFIGRAARSSMACPVRESLTRCHNLRATTNACNACIYIQLSDGSFKTLNAVTRLSRKKQRSPSPNPPVRHSLCLALPSLGRCWIKPVLHISATTIAKTQDRLPFVIAVLCFDQRDSVEQMIHSVILLARVLNLAGLHTEQMSCIAQQHPATHCFSQH